MSTTMEDRPFEFTAMSILKMKQFSWVFLVDWILIVILIIFMLFYVNQLIGWILTHLISGYLWHSRKIYFKVESIKLSLLGARIFFKNMVYADHNFAVRVIHGSLTWRYWLPQPRKATYFRKDGLPSNAPSCLRMVLNGLEIFIYNHSHAFDSMQEGVKGFRAVEKVVSKDLGFIEERYLSMLPLDMEVKQAAVIVGNTNTENLLIISTPNVKSIFDIGQPSNPYDRYFVTVNSTVSNPVVKLLPNLDFKRESAPNKSHLKAAALPRWYQRFFNLNRRSSQGGMWAGLPRYRDEQNPDEFVGLDHEYARVTTVFQTDIMDLEVYYDVPGPVTSKESAKECPPKFGYNIKLGETMLNYGPWTGRQKEQFWNAFSPQQFIDAKPAPEPEENDPRRIQQVEWFIKFQGSFVIRMPVREFSKNIEFLARARAEGSIPVTRYYGWVEVKSKAGSSISYNTDFYPTEIGTMNELKFESLEPEVRSSVNHDLMMRAHVFRLTFIQQIPLKWNGAEVWKILGFSENCDYFVLREHHTLISDALLDFSRGAPLAYHKPPPSVQMNVEITRFSAFFNVNSENIINNPTSFTENIFLVAKTDNCTYAINSPSSVTPPTYNTTYFDLKADVFDVGLIAPGWHTLESFLDFPEWGRIHDFNVQMVFDFLAQPQPNKIAKRQIKFYGKDVTMVAHGFIIDYLMTLKENYMGANVHFQTTEEFLEKEEMPPMFNFTRVSPDDDTTINVVVDRGCIVLPRYFYSAKDNLSFHFASLDIDCRITNYYVDLTADFLPITGKANFGLDPRIVLDLASSPKGDSVLLLNKLIVRAHRMFSVEPSAPTYVCKWDLCFGDLILNTSAEFLHLASQVGTAFGHSFVDTENKPLVKTERIYDATFLVVNVESVNASLHAEDDCHIEMKTGEIKLSYNNLANERYSSHSSLMIPFIEITAFVRKKGVFLADCSLNLTQFVNERNKDYVREAQQDHITIHDCLFHRCPFFLDDSHRYSEQYMLKYSSQPHVVPNNILPEILPPLNRDVMAHLTSELGDFEIGSGILESTASRSTKSQFGSFATIPMDWDESSSSSAKKSYSDDSNVSLAPSSLFDDAYDFFRNNKWNDLDLKDLHKKAAKFAMNPSPWNKNAPFPDVSDDDTEYSDLILELGAVNVILSPDILRIADLFVNQLYPVHIEASLDDLHAAIVRKLQGGLEKTCTRFHLVAPETNIKFGQLTDDSGHVPCLEGNCISIKIQGVDVMWKIIQGPAAHDPGIPITIQRSAHIDISSFVIGLQRKRSADFLDVTRLHSVAGQISNLTFWLSQEYNKEGCSCLNVENVDLFVPRSQVAWTCNYLLDMVNVVQQIRKDAKRPKSRRSNNTIYLLYALALFGDNQNTEEDAYILSRPWGPVYSEGHVRTHRSWRILMRLRHLLQHVPDEEIKVQECLLTDEKYELPDNVQERIIDIFDRWRSWEHDSDFGGAMIFNFVFDPPSIKKHLIKLFARTFIGLESLSIRLGFENFRECFFCLDYVIAQVLNKKISSTIKSNVTLACSKVRAHFERDILDVFLDILNTMSSKLASEQLHASRYPINTASENANGDDHTSHERKSNRTKFAIQSNVSFFIYDLSTQVCTDTLALEIQNHQVQLSAAIEYLCRNEFKSLYYAGVILSSTAGFRLFDPSVRVDLADYLVETLSVGFANGHPVQRSDAWISIKVASLSLALYPSLLEILMEVERFVKRDLVSMNKVIAKLRKELAIWRKPKDDGLKVLSKTSFERNDGKLGTLGIDVKVGSIKLIVLILEGLRLGLTGSNLFLRLRQPAEREILTSLELTRGALSALYHDNTPVGSLEIASFTAVARSDLKHHATEAFVKVAFIHLEMSSLMWMLEFLDKHHVVKTVSDIKQSLVSITNNFKTTLEDTPQIAETTSGAKLRLSTHGVINEILVALPLSTCAFSFKVKDLKLDTQEFESFESVDEQDCFSVAGSVSHVSLTVTYDFCDPETVFQMHISGIFRRAETGFDISFDSTHCETALNPRTIGSIIMAMKQLHSYSQDILATNEFRTAFSEPEDNAINMKKNIDFISEFVESHKIKIVIQELSVTWYFADRLIGDGVTIGLKEFKTIVVSAAAYMAIEQFYISPSACRHIDDVELRPNTACLPHVEVRAVILDDMGNKFVQVTIEGKTLGVTFDTGVGPLFAYLLLSFDRLENDLEKLEAMSPTKLTFEKVSSPQKLSGSPRPLRLPISIKVSAHFEETVLCLFQIFNQLPGTQLEKPTLELRIPSVEMITDYLQSDEGRDNCLLKINISPSKNEICPQAVQEIKGIVKSAKMLLRNRQGRRGLSRSPGVSHTSSEHVEEPVSQYIETRAADFYRFLTHVNLNIEIHIQSQEVFISFMPFNVGAMLHLGVTHLFVTSPRLGKEYFLSIWGTTKNAKMVLQHVHSRELSAGAELRQIVFSASQSKLLKEQKLEVCEPLKVGLLMVGLDFELKVYQLQDLRLLSELWPASEESPDLSRRSSLLPFDNKYEDVRKALAETLTLEIVLSDIRGVIHLGQSIGNVNVKLDRVWNSTYKNSAGDMQLAQGFGILRLDISGRLGGSIKLDGFNSRLSVFRNTYKEIPLSQIGFQLKHASFYLSLDFHPFLVGDIRSLRLYVMNHYKETADAFTTLVVACKLDAACLVMTALIASRLSDFMELLDRLKFVDHDPCDNKNHDHQEVQPKEKLDAPGNSKTKMLLHASIDELHTYMFPTEFVDSLALQLTARCLNFSLGQHNTDGGTLISDLDMSATSVLVGLAKIKLGNQDALTEIDVEVLTKAVGKASNGGKIIYVPSFAIAMSTRDSRASVVDPHVAFEFSSSFGGSVDVGWNIGSINFVRGLFETHLQFIKDRKFFESKRKRRIQRNTPISKLEEKAEEFTGTDDIANQSAANTSTKDANVTFVRGTKYVALLPPVIDIPTLRDMGDATPPVEWLGLHREKLPGAVHHYIVENLNEFVYNIRDLYTDVMSHI